MSPELAAFLMHGDSDQAAAAWYRINKHSRMEGGGGGGTDWELINLSEGGGVEKENKTILEGSATRRPHGISPENKMADQYQFIYSFW
jgi:hypothetical protein